MLLTLLLAVPFLTGLACFVAPGRVTWERLNLAGFASTGVLAAAVGWQVVRQGSVTALDGLLRADALSALVTAVTAFVSLVTAVYAVGYFRRDLEDGRISETQLRQYYAVTPLFAGAMLLVPLADNLGVMWVAVESTTLASVLLVAFYGRKSSFEAAWKYIIIGSVGVSLALFGTVLTNFAAVSVLGENTTAGMNWSTLVEVAERLDPTAMRLAFVLVVLGYGAKAGLAPMHTWKPDAYAEAPVPVATLLGAGFINCAVYCIMRFDVLAERCLGQEFTSRMLIGFGIFSIMLAAPFVLVQRNFRRLLAYSSIDHAGIMVAAVGFGGKWGLAGAVLHMVFHGVTKPLLFFAAGNVQQHFGSPYFRQVRGVIRTLPWTAGFFMLGAFAVTGTPPFGLFQSEFAALSGAMAGGHQLAAFLFVAGVVTIFAGFLLHLANLNLGCASGETVKAAECPWKFFAMLAVAGVVILLCLWIPSPLLAILAQSVRIINPSVDGGVL